MTNTRSSLGRLHASRRRGISSLVAFLAVLGICAPAGATHFRAGHIEWKHVGVAANHDIEFTVQNAWRQNGVSSPSGSNVYRCVNVASFVNQSTKLTTKPCTGPFNAGKFDPGVGDVFVEGIGSTTFDTGDGSVGGPGGDPLLYLVTSADPANNWIFALALDPTSLPAIDTTILHHYPNANSRTARISASARISPCVAPNAHMNNPDEGYRVEAVVDVADTNSGPTSSLPPVILCQQGGICSFTVPYSDNELDPVTFRMSTTGTGAASESLLVSQPGPPQCANDGLHTASINPTTGVYTWNTAGCRTAATSTPVPPAGGCGNGSLNTLYSTQVMIAEPGRNTLTALDFFIQLVPACSLNSSPVFNSPPSPLCGSTISGHPSTLLSFPIQASDPNAGDSVTLNAAGVPGGASLSPLLPTSGNPVNSTFSWTPTAGDLGQHVVTFSISDPCGVQQLCSITIDVSTEICGNGLDDDGDGKIDCVDPDCAGTVCNDNNPCTSNDVCSGTNAGCVGGAPTNCDDNNTCTDDGCSPIAGCTHTNNTASCSDGNACTTSDTCGGGSCNGGPAPSCDDNNACTADSCDQILGCQHVVQPNCQPCNTNADCNNNNACDGVETCVANRCQAGTPPTCDDSNVCTTDACNPSSGCTYTNNTDPCNDNNVCTTNDVCGGGLCGGSAISCDDQNGCTDDSCDQQNGCQHSNNTAPCDDGSVCTAGDVCSAGACVSGGAISCDDSNGCTDDSCDQALGCQHANNTSSCDDGNACTSGDTCSGGTCGAGPPTSCDDHNTCTDDSCDTGTGCVHVNNTNPCDDGSACTTGDTCGGGTCFGGPPPDCSDSNVCTSDTCNPATGCEHANVAGSCDDGNACTANDSCSAGVCAGGPPPNCNDGNVCTNDSCSPGTGCVHTNNTDPCSDNNACTGGDVCNGGLCVPGPAISCNDNNGCTDDSCNPAAGCTHTDNNDPCNDGDACTTADSCSGGSCNGGPPPNCNDNNVCTDDSCNSSSGCVHDNNTNSCSDNNACTSNDTCSGGSCVSGPALNCNDNNACTTDSCNTSLGCENPPEANCQPCSTNADCDNHNACDGVETCNAGRCQAGTAPNCNDNNVCTDDGCAPASGCTHLNNNLPCNDGDACTTADACSGGGCVGGPPPDCNDGEVCTTDTCVPSTGCTHPNNTNPCDDGNACTTNDACSGGSCHGGPPPVCNDGNPCTSDSCNSGSGCQTSSLANGTSCADSQACNGAETCQSGVCAPGTAVNCSGLSDQCNTANCVEPSGNCVVTPRMNGMGCEDHNSCTSSDRCQNGQCVGLVGADSDGDGYCDAREVGAGCSPIEAREIPPQANNFSGGRNGSAAEILLTFNTPRQKLVSSHSDPSCSALGTCDTGTGFCTTGAVADPCTTDSDCNQPAGQCRIVTNYGGAQDLSLLFAFENLRGHRKQDVSSLFVRVKAGCSRKVDLVLPPAYGVANLKWKLSGTADGRLRRDRDRILYLDR